MTINTEEIKFKKENWRQYLNHQIFVKIKQISDENSLHNVLVLYMITNEMLHINVVFYQAKLNFTL